MKSADRHAKILLGYSGPSKKLRKAFQMHQKEWVLNWKKNVVVSVLKLNKNDKTVHFKSAYKMKINSIQILFLNNF